MHLLLLENLHQMLYPLQYIHFYFYLMQLNIYNHYHYYLSIFYILNQLFQSLLYLSLLKILLFHHLDSLINMIFLWLEIQRQNLQFPQHKRLHYNLLLQKLLHQLHFHQDMLHILKLLDHFFLYLFLLYKHYNHFPSKQNYIIFSKEIFEYL